MDIWDTNKLLIFILFVIPGFFSIKVYGLLYPSQTKKFADQLIDAIAYSSMNYAFWIMPIYYFIKNKYYEQNFLLLWLIVVLVLFVSPIIWVFIWKKLRETNYVQKNMPHPIEKPWDYVFSQNLSYWIIVTLKDGTQLAGKYADESFTSSSPSSEQIYLEESWKLNKDGGFKRMHSESNGVLIVTSEISYLEFFQYNS
jgi:hypothetical protein